MTAKSVISSSPQADILAGNAATKNSSAHGASSGSAQFNDEFHSALQDRSSTSHADASKNAAASSTNVAKQQPQSTAASKFTSNFQQSYTQTTASNVPAVPSVPTLAGAATVPAVPATDAADATDEAAQAALSAAISKDVSGAGQTTTTGKTVATDGANDGSKDKKTKKSDSDVGTGVADPAAVSILGLPVIPVPVATTPAAASDSNPPAKSSDNSQAGQPSLTALPTFAAPAVTTATTSTKGAVTAADSSSSAPTGKESEAFAMLLTPKTATIPQQNATKDATQAAASENDGAGANPPVSPAKAAVNAVSMADENASDQAPDARKTVTSSATNSATATPSSLEQGSGTDSRSVKTEDKDDAVAPAAGAKDAAGNNQDFGGFGSTPDSFARETKVSGNTAPAAPATPTAETQDSSTAAAPGSAKEVAIRLEGQSGQTINVKLVDQGGQVQVSVRSNDPAAATALRGDLSSLASNLDKAGWKPEITTVAGGSAMETVSQTRPSDRNNQDSQGNRQPDWQQQDTPKKRPSVSDLWDQLLTAQNT